MTGRSTVRWLPLVGLVLVITAGIGLWLEVPATGPSNDAPAQAPAVPYRSRQPFSSSGNIAVTEAMEPWPASASLAEVARHWAAAPGRMKSRLDGELSNPLLPSGGRVKALIYLASLHHFNGHPREAYAVLEEARTLAEANPADAVNWLYTVVYYQGVTALRRGETENCVMCRGESSCILPLAPAAVHTNPGGSRLAIRHFTEYLEKFPDDYQVRWLLNLAHMTLGEHPAGVDPRFVIRLDPWTKSEFDLGKFRDVG